jgi:hypothetical protein
MAPADMAALTLRSQVTEVLDPRFPEMSRCSAVVVAEKAG